MHFENIIMQSVQLYTHKIFVKSLKQSWEKQIRSIRQKELKSDITQESKQEIRFVFELGFHHMPHFCLFCQKILQLSFKRKHW